MSGHDNIADVAKLCIDSHMRYVNLIAISLTVLSGTGCASTAVKETSAVFEAPSRFEGKTVMVCGRLLNGASNIHSTLREDQGLSIVANEEMTGLIFKKYQNRERLCLQGFIEHVGCETDPKVICVDWAFDYAIRVEEVR